MTNFLVKLIDRHRGVGSHVLPRTRTMFEPDAGLTFPLFDTSRVVAAGNDNSDSEPANSAQITPASTSVSSDAPEDTAGFHRAQERLVSEQGESGISTRGGKDREIEIRHRNDSRPVTAFHSISERPVGKDEKKTPDDERPQPVNPPQESIGMGGIVSEGFTGSNDNNVHESVASSDQVTTRDSLFASEQDHHIKPTKPAATTEGNTTRIQKVFDDQQPDRDHPDSTALQNMPTGLQDLLEPPIPSYAREQSTASGRLVSPEPGAEAEPVINITIGRIEIQATQPQEQTQPKRQKKPSSVMSLDQFLGRRTQGGNR